MSRAKLLEEILDGISFIEKVHDINDSKATITGRVEILFDGLDSPMLFDFEIYPQYPLKHHGAESIKFSNKDLLDINHVMQDGSICIHNSHNIDFRQKIIIDFNSLKQWIEKYYINKNNDSNYEHIVVQESLLNDSYYSYIFTDVDYKFKEGDFGEVKISALNNTYYKEKLIQNFLVNNFELNRYKISCKWSSYYKNLETPSVGLFYFLNNPPARYNKFIMQDWIEFDNLISQEFLNYLHIFQEKKSAKFKGKILPLFLGYKTVENEIHWQVALLEVGNFPIRGEAEKIFGVKTGKWNTTLIESDIKWALTRDSSYSYFFGRGTLDNSITESKILIIGVGAIGSMLARTLTRGGCKFIDIADYDTKEPENVCRSEYEFQFGLSDKVIELENLLVRISPFVNVSSINKEYFEGITKILYNDIEAKDYLISNINKYDIVFDSTTDNDLMYIFDSLELKYNLINISITNHAKELVCAFSPNIYHFVNTQFSDVLKNDLMDLYEPTGCWNPTFKASYNDINTLVQFAVRHINKLYKESKEKNNFIISFSDDEMQLKINEY